MPLKIGDQAPNFELLDTDLKKVNLYDVLGRGQYVVLLFFPGAFTSVCTKELCTFRDSMFKLEKAKANVIAVSVDTPFSLKAFKEQNKLNFTLASDFNKTVIADYDVVLPSLLGLRYLAKRAVYIISPDHTIKYVWYSDDPGKEPPYDEVVKTVNELAH
ncbi:MAG: peroxiredoxin [Thermocladium sp.]